MIRYKDINSGAIVNVRDDKVMDSQWEPYDGSADEAAGAYAGLKVDELKAEIEHRNESREDDAKISAEGKKADLIAALESDDAVSASK